MTLTFLKLGGSLITEKTRARTARLAVLANLSLEIRTALERSPETRLLLGHGSGSFGHVTARRHGTREGVRNPAQWRGFVEVWKDARALNEQVMAALQRAGVPALAFPPSASAVSQDGEIVAWEARPLRAALDAGLVPVVYGDVAFDRTQGGAVLSTEELFAHLARELRPGRILLAGREAGVWADYPARTRLLEEITRETFPDLRAALQAAEGADVTGGMAEKVQAMLALVAEIPGLEVRLFSGDKKGATLAALRGERVGTTIR